MGTVLMRCPTAGGLSLKRGPIGGADRMRRLLQDRNWSWKMYASPFHVNKRISLVVRQEA